MKAVIKHLVGKPFGKWLLEGPKAWGHEKVFKRMIPEAKWRLELAKDRAQYQTFVLAVLKLMAVVSEYSGPSTYKLNSFPRAGRKSRLFFP
jgi:hypothetical protein